MGLDCLDVLLQHLDDEVFRLKQIYDHCLVVLFHGLSNYNSHFLVRKLASLPMHNI